MSININDWLLQSTQGKAYSFSIREFSVNSTVTDFAKKIGQRIFESYRDPEYLKHQYKDELEEALFLHLETYVFPAKRDGSANGIQSIVKIGDFGEIITEEIVSSIDKLHVPLKKMMWKLRNDRSMFCTDLFAHNGDAPLKDLYYYEVKTRSQLSKAKSPERAGNFFVAVLAHDSLVYDKKRPNEHIADFLSRLHFELSKQASEDSEEAQSHRARSNEYSKIVKEPTAYNKKFGVCLILDKKNAYDEKIIAELESLPPSLTPLHIDVVLVEDLQSIISESFKQAYSAAKNYVYET